MSDSSPAGAVRKRGSSVLDSNILRPSENFAASRDGIMHFGLTNQLSTDSSPAKKRSKKIIIKSASESDSACPKLPLQDQFVDVIVKSIDATENGMKLLCNYVDSEDSVTVYLQGIWASSNLQPSRYLRLISPINSFHKELIVNDENGFVIVESDELVSCTSVSQAVFCKRKAVISQRFRGKSQANKAMLVGTIVHSLFQTAVLRKPRFLTRAWLCGVWRRELQDSFLPQMVALDLNCEELEEILLPYIESMVTWIQKYMPAPMGSNQTLATGSEIIDVVDIEENLWDSVLGIKGKVDLSLKVRTKDQLIAVEPLELKTGKSNVSAEHYGQTSVGDGSLLYLLDGVMRKVRPKVTELKGLIHLRNELASVLKNISENSFPAPLSDARLCVRCEHALTCLALQKTSEKSDDDLSFMSDLSAQIASHLLLKDFDYFKKWIRLIFLEWSASKNVKCDASNIWRMSVEAREKRGFCIAGLKVVEKNMLLRRLKVKFAKNDEQMILPVLTKGDMVVVSAGTRIAFAMGFVSSINNSFVEVMTEAATFHFNSGKDFILDRFDSNSVYPTNLNNVSLIMQNSPHALKLRSLLIEMRSPTFDKTSREDISKIASLIKPLNREQALAVLRSIMAQDYVVIEGFPGSGKTSTIVVLIRCLISLGRTVLITSFTHSAVDNLLLKLVKYVEHDQILRLGSSTAIRSELQKTTLEQKLLGISNSEIKSQSAKKLLKDTPIVACTCLEVASHWLFTFRRFSMTIVDEASQALECSLIPSLIVSDAFTLVGDSLQLAPLVQSSKAREEGMAVSLLERVKKHDKATVVLRSQYRMNRLIASLSSKLFYGETLVCANDCVAEAHLNVLSCNRDKLDLKRPADMFISELVEDAVSFIDTQSATFPEFKLTFGATKSACYNEGEITVVQKLCDLFLSVGVVGENIGVISFYRYQAEMLRKVIDNCIEVNTVDQYQGRDKSVIIVSFVWTENIEGRLSDLLADCRRINVALTRAKHKLILVGCCKSLGSFSTMASLIDLIPDRNIVAVNRVLEVIV